MVLIAQLTEEEYGNLDDRIKVEYAKGADDLYYPDIQEKNGWSFENVKALKETKDSERTRRVEWEKKAKDLEKKLDGVNLDEVKSLPKLKKEIADLKEAQNGDVSAHTEKIATLEREFQEKLTAMERERDEGFQTRDRSIKAMKIDQQANPIWAKLECITPELHAMELKSGTLVDAEGRILVVDEAGDPIQTKRKGAVGNMGLEEFLEGFKEKYPQNFKGSRATGGGGDPTAAGGGGNDVIDDSGTLNPIQNLRNIRSGT